MFILVCLTISLSVLASGGLTEAGEAYGGSTQITVLRNGEPISIGPSFETYSKVYLAPEPAIAVFLLLLFALGRRNL
ncbi:hypothetical protein IKZ80_00595 [bacterium]|nr:hypothetical protein [bacterium]MBR6463408.1 hypothetical protein [bacterium]